MSEAEKIARALTDDAIRERHGCACRKENGKSSSVTVYETEAGVCIDGCFEDRYLTPWQARYLAAKLYRLSRRIRDRSEHQSREAI